MSELFIYFRGESFHVRDLDGRHWTVRRGAGRGGEVRIPGDGSPIDPAEEMLKRDGKLWLKDEGGKKKKGGTYGRFAIPSGWSLPSMRGATHGLANALLQEGSWAWYTGWLGGVKRPAAKEVQHGYIPERNHKAAMDAATHTECGAALTATKYARLRSSPFSITSGHAHIAYEWCHLVAHGMGGSDNPDNIVAATAYQNTEQLILECVLHGYRKEGLQVEVQAKLATGWQHLAESIWYRVKLNHPTNHTSSTIYTRTMDARRATRPDFKEYAAVAREMRKCINTALVSAYPANHLNYEEWQLIQSRESVEPDESAGFWHNLTGG